jgi:hypothetical protein
MSELVRKVVQQSRTLVDVDEAQRALSGDGPKGTREITDQIMSKNVDDAVDSHFRRFANPPVNELYVPVKAAEDLARDLGKPYLEELEDSLRGIPGSRENKLRAKQEAKFEVSQPRARDRAAHTVFGQGKLPLSDSSHRMFRPLGVGISLYFLFLEYLASYFFWATVCAVPCLMLLKKGAGIPLAVESPLNIIHLTVANLGLHTDFHSPDLCGEVRNAGLCAGNQTRGIFTGENWSIDGAWTLLSWTDVAYSALFLRFIFKWARALKREVSEHGEVLSPADYTIFVSHLPPDCDETEVLNLFDQQCNPTEHMQYPLIFGCFGKPSEVREGQQPWPRALL